MNFITNKLKKRYDANLLFTDTGNLVYEIKIENVYEDFYKNKNLFNLVNIHCIRNSLIGKIKNEFKGKLISEFIGLKSKMYSLIAVDSEEVKKAKGMDKNVVKKISIKNLLMFCLIKK